MQSFLTIFVAGTAAFAAFIMMPAAPDMQTLELAEPVSSVTPEPVMMITMLERAPDKPLVLALDVGGAFEAGWAWNADAFSTLRDQ
jgi:hypothetical protein